MPELPEVETVRRGIAPTLVGRRLLGALVREPRLRWPVPDDLDACVRGRRITGIDRRGKYLLLHLEPAGALILHLGMSGSVRLVDPASAPEKHDHIDLLVDSGPSLRLRDPRRFGALLYAESHLTHPLIARLGVEPLSAQFDGARLFALTRGRRCAIKSLLMDAGLLVGVGNIYANESLYHAGIHPDTPAGRVTRARCTRLAEAIRHTLERAIERGGSTLRDFVDSRGKPGYFQQDYAVYGRTGAPCHACGAPVREMKHGNRATFYCPGCQKR